MRKTPQNLMVPTEPGQLWSGCSLSGAQPPLVVDVDQLVLDLTPLETNLANLQVSGSPTTIPSIIQAQNVKITTDFCSPLFSIST